MALATKKNISVASWLINFFPNGEPCGEFNNYDWGIQATPTQQNQVLKTLSALKLLFVTCGWCPRWNCYLWKKSAIHEVPKTSLVQFQTSVMKMVHKSKSGKYTENPEYAPIYCQKYIFEQVWPKPATFKCDFLRWSPEFWTSPENFHNWNLHWK